MYLTAHSIVAMIRQLGIKPPTLSLNQAAILGFNP